MPEGSAGQSRATGQVVTFYSFKGGTGRTMALANVAWILAANGRRVLMADWDLESPGLHRFFQPFMPAGMMQRPGIIDIIRRYAWAAVDSEIDRDALFESGDSRRAALQVIIEVVNEHIDKVQD